MKVFISQAMSGLSNEEILNTRREAMEYAKNTIGLAPGDHFEFIDSYFPFYTEDTAPLYLLGRAIQKLAEADVCLFVGNWEKSRGCQIEHECCVKYGIPRVYFSLLGTDSYE